MKFFHNYTNRKRNIYSIWELEMNDSKTVTSQQDLKVVAVSYFSSIFKYLGSSNIVSQLQIIQNYPKLFIIEEVDLIGSPISSNEIKGVMKLFSKDKSLGPDSLAVELFLSFFDLMGPNLCKESYESIRPGKVVKYINSSDSKKLQTKVARYGYSEK